MKRKSDIVQFADINPQKCVYTFVLKFNTLGSAERFVSDSHRKWGKIIYEIGENLKFKNNS